mgnify:CR=1 FL=1
MPIIFASTAGFCYGVRRAVKLALNASQKDSAELVTLGPLVHNQQAIDLLKSRGVTIVKKAEDVPKGSRVIIRAHGVTPQVRDMLAAKCSEVYDATCPHVTRAQQIVAQYAADGWAVLIIGDRGHAGVAGQGVRFRPDLSGVRHPVLQRAEHAHRRPARHGRLQPLQHGLLRR